MTVLAAANHEHAQWMANNGETAEVYIHTAEPGYTLRYQTGTNSYTMLRNGGSNFQLSGTTLKYDRGGSSYGTTITENVYGFLDDISAEGLQAGMEKLLELRAGEEYDHDSVDGDFIQNPIGTIEEFFTTLKGEYDTPYEKYKDNNTYANLEQDEDEVDLFLTSSEGKEMSAYFKAFNVGATDKTVQSYLESVYIPVALPVGTIVEGVYGQYGIPTPPNLKLMNGSTINDSKASPYLKGRAMSNYYNKVGMMTVSNIGGYSGSNSKTISKSNLPTDPMTASVTVKPQGTVSVNSYSGSVSTSSDSALEADVDNLVWTIDPTYNGDYWDTASALGGSGNSFPTVQDETETMMRLNHNHTVNISHGHSATFNGYSQTHSVTMKMNTGSSQSSFNVMQESVNVQKYLVIY